MAIALLFVGIILIVTAIRGTHAQLWNLVVNDMTGAGGGGSGFLVWLAAIVAVGAIGFYKPAEKVSDMLLGLIILAIFISNRGVFANFSSAISGIGSEQPTAASDPTTANLPAGIPIEQVGGSSSSSGALGQASQALGLVGSVLKLF